MTNTQQELFYKGFELKMQGQYEKAIEHFEKYLDTKEGEGEDKILACIQMAECYRALENLEKEIESLVRSINYDVPRPEVSCRMGDLYQKTGNYDRAILWYQLALVADTKKISEVEHEAYSTWYPYMQLCVCHWHKGEKEEAYEYHKLAKEYRPKGDPSIVYNDEFFRKHFPENEEPKIEESK